MKELKITMHDDGDITYEISGDDDFSYFELFGLVECFKLKVAIEYRDKGDQ